MGLKGFARKIPAGQVGRSETSKIMGEYNQTLAFYE